VDKNYLIRDFIRSVRQEILSVM